MPHPPINPGRILYVDGINGKDQYPGLGWSRAKKTLAAAVSAAQKNDDIILAPGQVFAEQIVIPRTLTGITIRNEKTRLSTSIDPSSLGAAKVALTVHADDFTIQNVDLVGSGDANGRACIVTGRRFHAVGCKLESAGSNLGIGLIIGPGLIADIYDANSNPTGTKANGSDSLMEDCEFAWLATAIILQGSDYGAATENRFTGCRFHNLSAAGFEEAHTTPGDAQHQFASLEIHGCLFEQNEAGADPSGGYVVLNDDGANKGFIAECDFPSASNGGKALAGTGIKWADSNSFAVVAST